MPAIRRALAQAKSHHRAGQLQLAEQIYRQIIAADPANAEAYYLLGALCQRLGRLDEVVANLRQAVRLNPAHAEVHNYLGMTFAEKGAWDEAIASFEKALRLRPNFAEAQQNLRRALAARQRDEERLMAAGFLAPNPQHFHVYHLPPPEGMA